MDLKKVLLEEVHQLLLSEITVKELLSSLELAMNKLSYGELTDFFMLHAEAIEVTSRVELTDQIISDVNQSPKGTITVPYQVTEIVSYYFNMPIGSSLNSSTMGLGMAATDLMELNEDVMFYGQGHDNHSFMLAELRFYMRNIIVKLAYGDVISKPQFIEGNQPFKQFDFVYMAPPFGIKINHEQEQAIDWCDVDTSSVVPASASACAGHRAAHARASGESFAPFGDVGSPVARHDRGAARVRAPRRRRSDQIFGSLGVTEQRPSWRGPASPPALARRAIRMTT